MSKRKTAVEFDLGPAPSDGASLQLAEPERHYLPSERRPDAEQYHKLPPTPMALTLESEKLELILDQIAAGVGLRELASRYGVALRTVQVFLEHPSRSARVIEARRQSAWLWDEKAEDEIRQAQDQLEATKAREIASHYRWRAAAIAPREYGKAGAQEPVDPTLGALAVVGAAALREQLAAMVGAIGIGVPGVTVLPNQAERPAIEHKP